MSQYEYILKKKKKNLKDRIKDINVDRASGSVTTFFFFL